MIIYFHCKTARGGKCAYNAAEARVPPTLLDFLFCSTASCSGQVRDPQRVQELATAMTCCPSILVLKDLGYFIFLVFF